MAPWSSKSKKGVDGGSNIPKMHPESGDKGHLKREDPDRNHTESGERVRAD